MYLSPSNSFSFSPGLNSVVAECTLAQHDLTNIASTWASFKVSLLGVKRDVIRLSFLLIASILSNKVKEIKKIRPNFKIIGAKCPDDSPTDAIVQANEINQIWIVEHAYKRQEFICQSQSVNLFFTLPKATEPQETHDEYMQYVNDVHWYAMNKLKSLYYFRSDAARNAENVNVKVQRVKLEDVECLSCEG